MRIITHYIGIHLIKAIVVVTVLLLAVDLFFYFINELRFIGVGDYNLMAACEFVGLTIPRKIYKLSPWSALIGSFLALGSMVQNFELLFMRTIGLSINRIALHSGLYVLYFAVIIFLIGEVLVPKCELIAQARKTLALSQGRTIYTEQGMWIKQHNKFVHIAATQNYHTLHGVTIYYFDDNLALNQVLVAKSAKLIAGNVWELQDIIMTKLPQFNKDVIIQHHDASNHERKIIKLDAMQEMDLIELNLLKSTNIKRLERLSLKNLIVAINNRVANHLNVKEYEIALWQKILQPFTILIMSYLVFPFVIGPLRSCATGLRLLVGVIVGASFYFINALFAPVVTVFNLPAMLAAVIPPITFLLFGVYLVKKC